MSDKNSPAASADDAFSFPAAELDVLRFWEEARIFERSLEATADGDPYIFYDGPPFATGLPHHGHLVASTIKDIVPRYWTMKGRHVRRRFGWDCHGLPIEHEIDKQYEASVHDVIKQLGVAGYNDACRSIVQRYVGDWRKTITRLGRWVDFDNDYKTMDTDYMESVWWVVKQLWDRGLIYQGHKVMPFSTALGTVLANFEATQNYQDTQDPAVTVLMRITDWPGATAEDVPVYAAAWTTTPWTLPSNLALCVGPDIEYLRVRDSERGIDLLLAESRLETYLKQHDLEIVSRTSGSDLVGLHYEPLFNYFADEAERGAFVVVADGYVTTDSGTGIVHQAPAFGEDDFRVLREAGIEAFVCPVDDRGCFTSEVPDFENQHVKEADREIIRHLRDTGSLYQHDTIEHSYPFCYRSDTPLIYKAIPSWYVRVTEIRDRLLAANAQIHWVPEHIKEGRFGNWLEGAIDWSISRNRVWGTPLPLWVNDETDNVECIGSLDELEALTGARLTDLHREHVDDLTFTREGEPGVYRRVPEVLDCWFESGSMPYAQLHYPFENRELFEAGFPAEFIAEGLDQTRGWFYTLVVLGAALYDAPAFRNVIVNGLVMAADGKKMSKRLRNYTPPDDLMSEYGADALRLYLINSGIVRGEEMRFADDGVRDMVRRALLPWKNAFNFLETYARIDGWSPQANAADEVGDNVLDRWILSRLQTLLHNVTREMDGYRLYAVVPQLFTFIEDLTNWYIRLNRPRFWAEDDSPDKRSAYAALYTTLDQLGCVMAPFAPFLAEHVHRALAAFGADADRPESVHLARWPAADDAFREPQLEAAVERMQQIILLGRQKREEERINLRTPLARVTVVHRDPQVLDEVRRLESWIARELNVKEVAFDTDEAAWIRLYCKPNFRVLGRRLGKRMKDFQKKIEALTVDEIEAFQASGELVIDGERFGEEEVQVFREAAEGTGAVSNRLISLQLDCEVTPELEQEGRAREVTRAINNARKENGFQVSDRVVVTWRADGELAAAIAAHAESIQREALAVDLVAAEPVEPISRTVIDGHGLDFSLRIAAR